MQQLGVHRLRAGAWTYPYLVLARGITPNERVAFGRSTRDAQAVGVRVLRQAADDESIVGGSMMSGEPGSAEDKV